MVMNQNAAAAITASSTATITSLRSIGTLLRFYSISSGISRSAVRIKAEGGPSRRRPPPTVTITNDDYDVFLR
jgi:hypothetical protein